MSCESSFSLPPGVSIYWFAALVHRSLNLRAWAMYAARCDYLTLHAFHTQTGPMLVELARHVRECGVEPTCIRDMAVLAWARAVDYAVRECGFTPRSVSWELSLYSPAEGVRRSTGPCWQLCWDSGPDNWGVFPGTVIGSTSGPHWYCESYWGCDVQFIDEGGWPEPQRLLPCPDPVRTLKQAFIEQEFFVKDFDHPPGVYLTAMDFSTRDIPRGPRRQYLDRRVFEAAEFMSGHVELSKEAGGLWWQPGFPIQRILAARARMVCLYLLIEVERALNGLPERS